MKNPVSGLQPAALEQSSNLLNFSFPENPSALRNLSIFLNLNKLTRGFNPLDNHSIFENCPIISEGWAYPTKKIIVNPRRSRYDSDLRQFARFEAILSSVGFDKESPICLDRKGRLLDGAYRLWVMANLNEVTKGAPGKIYFRQYDFE